MSDAAEGPSRLALWQQAAAVGLLATLPLLLQIPTLARMGWEAWGGVLVLAAAGASSASWRTSGSSIRATSLASVAGVSLVVGALARSGAPLPAFVLASMSLFLAWRPPPGKPLLRIAPLGVFAVFCVLGFVWAGDAAPMRVEQVGAAFALGALAQRLFPERGRGTGWIVFVLVALGTIVVGRVLA